MSKKCVCGCQKAYSIRGFKKAYSNWLQNSMHIKDCRMALLSLGQDKTVTLVKYKNVTTCSSSYLAVLSTV